MTVSQNVPQHLVVGARSGFLAAMADIQMPWRQVAGEFTMTSKAIDLVDLGGAPMPLEDIAGAVSQDFIERAKEIKPRNWQLTVGVSYNAVQDDQTGSLERKVRAAAENFQRHINKLVFLALDDGADTTYGTAYDALAFFDGSHLNGSQSTYDNEFALALSLDNFQTNLNLARLFTDESGEYVDAMYNTLIVPPALERIAANIVGNTEDYATGNRAINPYSGKFSLVVTPYFDTTAWVVAAVSPQNKPLWVAWREQPFLQDAWFDPKGGDGGMYNFKFYGRYNIAYGDPRLAFLGNT